MTIDPTSTPGKIRSPLSGLRRPRVIVWSIIGFLVVSLVALFWAPQFLLEHWLSNLKVDAATVRLALGNAAQVVLFSLGGLIALVGVGLSLSRHGLELENSQADRIKEQRRVSELDEQRHIDKERAATMPTSENRRAMLADASVGFLAPDRGEWTADGKNYVNGLFKMLHTHGSHPSLSDEDHCTFRLHVVLVTARTFLRRLWQGTR